MIEIISKNISTIIVGALMAAAVIAAVLTIIRQKKEGRFTCGGNCSACATSELCTTRMAIPEHIQKALSRLVENGYEGYIVGGCVRDTIMGKTPHDWDVCTSAKPEEIKKCFEENQLIEIGKEHGTIGVVLSNSETVEMTTYRVDGAYTDSRHPDRVSFTRNIKEDLARRDFTMNAIAYNRQQGHIDPFGGRRDIEERTIRTVGDPHKRFCEDALRIMRGLRFAAVLGFEIAPETYDAMNRLADTVQKVSAERIQSELAKMIEGDYVDQVMADYSQALEKAIPGIQCRPLGHLPKNKSVRLARLFPQNTEKYMMQLKTEKKTGAEAVALARLFASAEPEDKIAVKKCIRTEGLKIATLYMEAIGRKAEIQAITQKEECCTAAQLEVNGSDLIEIGIKDGKTIGRTLERLLDQVIEDKIPNKKEYLMNAICKIKTVYFSPTGSTETVTKTLARSLAKRLYMPVEETDVRTPESREKNYIFNEEDVVVIACPTYAGRVPNKIMPFFRDNLEGNGAKAVLAVTYGNRSFGYAFMELRHLAENNGFKVAGGVTVPCQHAFAGKLAAGRPDENDIKAIEKAAEQLAEQISKEERAREQSNIIKDSEIQIGPYYVPKKTDGQPAVFLKAKPETDREKCIRCGLCFAMCPMGSISRDDPSEVLGICIKCQGCIKACKTGAKFFTNEDFLEHKKMLEENFAKDRKEVEIYL